MRKHHRCPPSRGNSNSLCAAPVHLSSALYTEADRLSGVYLLVRILAQAQHIDVMQAGEAAVAKGLITEKDWAVVREAISERG